MFTLSLSLALEMAEIKSNQAYYKDVGHDNFSFLLLNSSSIVTPLDMWPGRPSGTTWTASDLKMTTHFIQEEMNSTLVPLIQNFLKSITIKAELSPQLDERCIEVELLHVTADMLECTLMLKHVRESEGT